MPTTTESNRRVELKMQIQRFRLPPVEAALVVGRRSAIGPKAMNKALAEMVPGTYELVDVDHATIEAVIVRTTHLRTLPKERLITLLVSQCESMMDETDMIHVDLDVIVHATEQFEI